MTESILNHTNHESFLGELRDFVAESRHQEGPLAFLVVYTDDVSRINTTLGYETGRKVLLEITGRLNKVLRTQDRMVRIGDCKFALLLPNVKNSGHAALAANKVHSVSSQAIEINGNSIAIGLTVGIALCPDHALEAESLLQKAELALQSAREFNKPFVIYSQEAASKIAEQWELESELDNAILNDELELYYQPKVRADSGEVSGVEALMRWNNAQRGIIPPDVFIPMADQNGKIKPLTWFAIKTALRQLREWPADYMPLSVSVNLTPNIIMDLEVVKIVKDAIKIWDVDPSLLTLEVTEGALMVDPTTSFRILGQLKDLGVKISIDDFGTGYSSLAYFKDIPSDELKIDKSFVFRMLYDEADAKIIKTIINLAHSFELSVVGEGVENKETMDALAEQGCDYAQGYHLTRPIPQKEFITWLKNYQPQQ